MSTYDLRKTSKLTHLLSFLATSVVVLGILALYYPHILQQNLPDHLMAYLAPNSWMPTTIFITGIVLNFVAITVNVLTKGSFVRW